MERFRVSTSPTENVLEDGTTISAQVLEKSKPIPGDVAMHEAAHVVAAGEIVFATIIPSGDASGRTQPKKMTAAAAAAAEALGHSGTSWDMHLTEHILGVDPGVTQIFCTIFSVFNVFNDVIKNKLVNSAAWLAKRTPIS